MVLEDPVYQADVVHNYNLWRLPTKQIKFTDKYHINLVVLVDPVDLIHNHNLQTLPAKQISP